MAYRREKMNAAVNQLSKYFGLQTTSDLAKKAAELKLQGELNPSNTAKIETVSNVVKEIASLFLDNTDGAYSTIELIKQINQKVRGILNPIEREKARKDIAELFEIYFKDTIEEGKLESAESLDNSFYSSINSILDYDETQDQINRINTNGQNPTKSRPSLSLMLSNTNQISLTSRNASPVVIFMNGIPNVEMSRATPYVNVEIYTPAGTSEDNSNRVKNLSLSKFLVGAEQLNGGSTPLSVMVNGDTISGQNASRNPISDVYTVAGMEIFTSPQTLVNADFSNARTLSSTQRLDKFQPFLSLQSLSINVRPSTGMMSYKTADMVMVLHDRSRMSEIANFIRADLYGTTEIMLEYGWAHPDGEKIGNSDNAYGDLINGMRVKEKYGIVNSSFTFGSDNSVSITLALAMRGGVEFSTELIASDGINVGNTLKEIEDLQKTIGDYRARLFQDGPVVQEVRGIQILDAAQDALNYVSFNGEVRKELANFKESLSKSTPQAKELIRALENLFGSATAGGRARGKSVGGRNTNGQPALVDRIKKSVIDGVKEKMLKMARTPDPFIKDTSNATVRKNNRKGRLVEQPKNKQQAQQVKQFLRENDIPGLANTRISIAKLFLLFVGEPLVNTGKFDDVQLVFYPFNKNAGFASQINIANFTVDSTYFAREYARYRLERISRSGNMTLKEFLMFISEIIIDDPAAESYGLYDAGGALFRQIPASDGSAVRVEAVDDPPSHIQRMENLLKDFGGVFKMPQVDLYAECLPEKTPPEDGVDFNSRTRRTVLKIHIFDRQASQYDTVNSINASLRNETFETIEELPPLGNEENVNTGVVKANASQKKTILEAARNLQMLERIPNTEPPMYRIRGSIDKLKDFIYSTTPYLIYGAAGSNIISANLSSIQNSALNTVNLLRSFRSSEIEPNGENPGGLPMRIIPTELSMTTMGCPIIDFAQQFFVDFQTGTTADNLYAVVGLTHNIGQGEFTTSIKFAPLDSYARYMSFVDRVKNATNYLKSIDSSEVSAAGLNTLNPIR